MTGFAGSRNFRGAVADGYLAIENIYDAYMYIIGKGKSTTTVTAPDVAVPKGTALSIKGTGTRYVSCSARNPMCIYRIKTLQVEDQHLSNQSTEFGTIKKYWSSVTLTAICSDMLHRFGTAIIFNFGVNQLKSQTIDMFGLFSAVFSTKK